MLRLESQTRFWLFAFLLFGALLWILKPVLLPFLVGMTLAYFLNPVVDCLEKRKMPRWVGALSVLFGFGLIVGLILMLILPLLQSQIGSLVNALPSVLAKIRSSYLPWVEGWLARFSPDDVEKLRDAAGQSATEAAGWIANLLKSIVSEGVAFIDVMLLMIVTPVVAFYMMRDWPILTKAIDRLFPQTYYSVIHEQLTKVDNTLSGFIRGQALVCLSLGTLYTIGLTLVGLKYSAAIGVTAGLLSFIPYVGTIFGWIASLVLGFVQFNGDWPHIGMIVGVFMFGHFLEAYILTPKLVGHRVGLHPVWILFALITGARLMGFTGILIAVPSAAVIGVLTRFAVSKYRSSRLYKQP